MLYINDIYVLNQKVTSPFFRNLRYCQLSKHNNVSNRNFHVLLWFWLLSIDIYNFSISERDETKTKSCSKSLMYICHADNHYNPILCEADVTIVRLDRGMVMMTRTICFGDGAILASLMKKSIRKSHRKWKSSFCKVTFSKLVLIVPSVRAIENKALLMIKAIYNVFFEEESILNNSVKYRNWEWNVFTALTDCNGAVLFDVYPRKILL